MDRKTAKVLGEKVLAAVQAALGAEYRVRLVRGTFSDVLFTTKVEISEPSAGEYPKEAAALREAAHFFGLKSGVVGQTLSFGAKGPYVVVGLRGNGTANAPILCKRLPDGKVFCFPVEAVRAAARPKGFTIDETCPACGAVIEHAGESVCLACRQKAERDEAVQSPGFGFYPKR